MVKTRLLKLVGQAAWQGASRVVYLWLGLLCEIILAISAGYLLGSLAAGGVGASTVAMCALGGLWGLVMRFLFDQNAEQEGQEAANAATDEIRRLIHAKTMRLGATYREHADAARITRMSGEGAEQIGIYVGRYLPQFAYALLASLTLFAVIAPLHLRTALVLLAFVPLTPLVIMIVMITAKRLLSQYFDAYERLGDGFLDRMRAMGTLKLYQADRQAARDMAGESEEFRRVTMKVLRMQLISSLTMDAITIGGAACGALSAIAAVIGGTLDARTAIIVLILAADYLTPMRRLGSLFHAGMNGMKMADVICGYLDEPEPEEGGATLDGSTPLAIAVDRLSYTYPGADKPALSDATLHASAGSMVALIGESGSGKSTLAHLLAGRITPPRGAITINGTDITRIDRASLAHAIPCIGAADWIAAGSIRYNLQLARPDATDDDMRRALRQARLDEFADGRGLDHRIETNAANLSGGQRQKLSLARALLAAPPALILDEATSNIDPDSERDIMGVIRALRGKTTIILITHRLANAVDCDAIHLLQDGRTVQTGTHAALLAQEGPYRGMFDEQRALEAYADARQGAAGARAADTAGGPARNAAEAQMPPEPAAPSMKGRTVMRRLLRLVRPLTPLMLLAILLGTLGFLCAIGVPVVEADALAGTAWGGAHVDMGLLALVLLGGALLRGVLHYGEQYCNHDIAFRLLALVRGRVFDALRRLAPAKTDGRGLGALLDLITGDIELLEVFFAHTVSPIGIAVATSVAMTLFVCHIHWAAGLLVALSYIVVGLILPLWNSRRTQPVGEGQRAAAHLLDDYVMDTVDGLDEIIQYGAGDIRLDGMERRSERAARHNGRMGELSGTQTAAVNALIWLFSWAMIALTALLHAHGDLDATGMVVAVFAQMSSFGPLAALASLSTTLAQTLACGRRVLGLLDETPAVADVEGREPASWGGAEMERVTFSYPAGNVVGTQRGGAAEETSNASGAHVTANGIHDVTLHIPENAIIGIHGPSGSGKSTLLKLLMRFWDADSGSITFDGRDIREVNTADLRAMTSPMVQDTAILSDTVAHNIALGAPGATQAQIEEAARKASVHETIMALPDGYATRIGEGGAGLSTGERQRIGLARAFCHAGPLMLLDEPTSSVDTLNEAAILRSLDQERAGRTIILVSHRATTMAIADVTAGMSEGRLAADGQDR